MDCERLPFPSAGGFSYQHRYDTFQDLAGPRGIPNLPEFRFFPFLAFLTNGRGDIGEKTKQNGEPGRILVRLSINKAKKEKRKKEAVRTRCDAMSLSRLVTLSPIFFFLFRSLS